MMSGRFAEAERVAVRTAESIEPSGNAAVQDLSAYGSLLITAATAAPPTNRLLVHHFARINPKFPNL